MKAIVDTNVVHSGVFYGGLPGRVLEAWRDKRFTLVLSAPILAEYRATGAEFEANYGGADFEAFGLSMTPFALHLASLTTLRDSRRCKPGGPPKIRCVQPAAPKLIRWAGMHHTQGNPATDRAANLSPEGTAGDLMNQ